jgi:hypothetical protein
VWRLLVARTSAGAGAGGWSAAATRDVSPGTSERAPSASGSLCSARAGGGCTSRGGAGEDGSAPQAEQAGDAS